MDFLIHLAVIAGGLFWLALFIRWPGRVTVWTGALGAGAVWSSGGIAGTMIGLVAGALGGWALALLARGAWALYRRLNPQPWEEIDRLREEAEAKNAAR